MKTTEQVYDEEISPLMSRIIDICIANRIPMLAHFSLGPDPKKDGHNLAVSSAIAADRQMQMAMAILGAPSETERQQNRADHPETYAAAEAAFTKGH